MALGSQDPKASQRITEDLLGEQANPLQIRKKDDLDIDGVALLLKDIKVHSFCCASSPPLLSM